MDLNAALLHSSTGAMLAGSKISAHAVIESLSAASVAMAVTVPGGAIGVYLGGVNTNDWAWSAYAAGTSAPGKDAANAMYVATGVAGGAVGPQYIYLALDPNDPPALFVEETAGTDTTIHAVFILA
jgi:hypothetical protein